ncbi:MAG: flagellin [Planctomycetes bacterium]|nr:flagellin [Planctomycetota bacterium]
MSSINTNVPSMIAQRVLNMQNRALVVSLERLSTGLRINRGKDDPAGLIASENLRAEKMAISSAITNATRAEQVINVAEGGLHGIAGLIVELQGLIGASANEAGLSQEEKEANQLQIDSILQTIDRLANDTSFQGSKLLNGNFDYTTTGIATSITDVTINAARLPAGATLDVNITMITSGQTAQAYLSTGASFSPGGTLTIEVTGADGVQQFTFASGSSQANIISAINTFKDAIGVSAVQNTTDTNLVELRSLGYGSTQFVRVKQIEGGAGNHVLDAPGGTHFADLKDFGRDATVLINGIQAIADGLEARVATAGFDVSVTIDGTGILNVDGAFSTFTITGGGANFNLSPDVSLSGKVSLGIETVTTGNLGKSGIGFLTSMRSGGTANVINGDLALGQKIVDEAVKQVSALRGRLGAFQKNTIGATINSLSIALENTAAAESAIRDTDFAAETAELTRRQIMVQAATQALSIANLQPQAVLALLG